MSSRSLSVRLLVVLVLLGLAGCGDQPAPEPATEAPAADSAAGPTADSAGTAPTGSAVLEGTVRYDGEVPTLRPIKMDADPGCAKKHTSAVMPETLVLGEGNTIANVFVYVKSGLPAGSYAAPDEPVVFDQSGCRYVPHVAGVMVGQTFHVLNSDGLLHNVHSLPKINKGFNRAMPASVTEAEYSFDREEFMFKIKCDVHPWMGAYVSVMSHPYFTVTGKDGSYSIAELPAGTYEIEAWHERLGTQTSTLEVADGETKSHDFTFAR